MTAIFERIKGAASHLSLQETDVLIRHLMHQRIHLGLDPFADGIHEVVALMDFIKGKIRFFSPEEKMEALNKAFELLGQLKLGRDWEVVIQVGKDNRKDAV